MIPTPGKPSSSPRPLGANSSMPSSWANVKRKTDKDDALKLARLAATGELKGVHVPSAQHREFRSLVKYRKTLDRRINKTKNTIRAWFVNHGIEIDGGEKASGMHIPWAVSNRNHVFGAQSRSGLARPTDTFHPHCLSVYASTLDFGSRLIPTLQNSILGVWLTLTQAGFPPASLQDIASPHVDVMGLPPVYCTALG